VELDKLRVKYLKSAQKRKQNASITAQWLRVKQNWIQIPGLALFDCEMLGNYGHFICLNS
jgi:hypothetical protein